MQDFFSPLNFLSSQDLSRMLLNSDPTSGDGFEWIHSLQPDTCTEDKHTKSKGFDSLPLNLLNDEDDNGDLHFVKNTLDTKNSFHLNDLTTNLCENRMDPINAVNNNMKTLNTPHSPNTSHSPYNSHSLNTSHSPYNSNRVFKRSREKIRRKSHIGTFPISTLYNTSDSESGFSPASIDSPQLFTNLDENESSNDAISSKDYFHDNNTQIEGYESENQIHFQEEEESDDEESDFDRAWTTFFEKESFISSSSMINIKHRTRRETPRNTVEKRLYSSLKYIILLEACEKEFKHEVQFLMARIFVNDDTGNPVDTKVCGQPISGVIETALTKQPDLGSILKGQLFIQLSNSLSFHKHKRMFQLEIRYYTPNDLENEVLVKRSPLFRVYARKPNLKKCMKQLNDKSKYSGRKRKKHYDSPINSNQKNTNPISNKIQIRTKKRRKNSIVDPKYNNTVDWNTTDIQTGNRNLETNSQVEIKKDLNGFMTKLSDLFSFMTNKLSPTDSQLANAILYHKVLERHASTYTKENQDSLNFGHSQYSMNMFRNPSLTHFQEPNAIVMQGNRNQTSNLHPQESHNYI